MKKIFGVFVLILFVSVSSIFALGIGIQGNFNAGPNSNGGVSATLKTESVPFVFAGNLAFSSRYFTFGVTADHWVLNDTFIQEPFKWYIGWGLYTNMIIADPFGLSLGVRLPLGINAFFANDFIEPYLQVAPSLGLSILPDLNFPDWFIPINLGVRFWL